MMQVFSAKDIYPKEQYVAFKLQQVQRNYRLRNHFGIHVTSLGAQWLSGRVLDSRPKGSGFEPHRRHCVVVLEQDTFILA